MGDSIMTYNGGTVLAMAGEGCVAIASDLRFGVSRATVSAGTFPKLARVTPRCYVGCSGLATDVQTLLARLKAKATLYELSEEREITPAALSSALGALLYEHRFGPYFTEPIVAGIDPQGKPYLAGMDLIGAPVFAQDFVAAGTGIEGLCGTCESLWRPALNPEQLFEVTAQCILSALDRDSLSGWGAVVHVLTPETVTTRYLKTRQD
eukprot:m51a1_g5910 putative cg11981-pa (208) ;mRNA; r:9969-10685